MYKHILYCVAFVACATGCSSGSSQKTTTPAPATTTTVASADTVCRINGTATSAIGPNATANGGYNANGIAAFDSTEQQRKSFCDFLIGTNKKVAVFQLAGVACLTCQTEARNLTQGLARSQYASSIAQFIVFTDLPNERNATVVGNFMSQYTSQQTLSLFDDQQKIWTLLSPSRAFGTVLIIDLKGDVQLISQEGQEAAILSTAERFAAQP